tara:strand:- start:5010 stop:5420 length:411 start_codon:yes stop_codon:yes gene_type:complete
MLTYEALFKFHVFLPDFKPTVEHENFMSIDFEHRIIKNWLNGIMKNGTIDRITFPNKDVVLLDSSLFCINIPNARLPQEFYLISKNKPSDRMFPISYPSVKYVLKDKSTFFKILDKISDKEKDNGDINYKNSIHIF